MDTTAGRTTVRTTLKIEDQFDQQLLSGSALRLVLTHVFPMAPWGAGLERKGIKRYEQRHSGKDFFCQ